MSSLISPTRQAAISNHGHRLGDIPPSTFKYLVALSHEGHNPESLHVWLDIVLEQHRDLTESPLDEPFQQVQMHKTPQVIEIKTPYTPVGDVRYFCHRCPEAPRRSKDFIRHVEEVCEPVREWRCLDCSNTYRRADRFRRHHRQLHLCGPTGCTHASAAERRLPTRAAHGCGFCTHCFQSDLRGFLNHLVKHYKEGCTSSDWSVTTNVQSLLLQPNVFKVWYQICSDRFQTSPELWPIMSWTRENATEYINQLEWQVPENELYVLLPKLLEVGLGSHPVRHDCSPIIAMRDTRPSLSIDTECVSNTPRPNTAGESLGSGMQYTTGYSMTDTMTSAWYDGPEAFSSPTSATVVDNEHIWQTSIALEKGTAGFGDTSTVNLTTSSSVPSFDFTFAEFNNQMDLDNAVGGDGDFGSISDYFNIDFDETEHPNTIVESSILPDMEKINMTSVSFLNPDESPTSNENSSMDTELIPPFNTTPSLKPPKGHRRSISRTILRALESIPSFPSLH